MTPTPRTSQSLCSLQQRPDTNGALTSDLRRMNHARVPRRGVSTPLEGASGVWKTRRGSLVPFCQQICARLAQWGQPRGGIVKTCGSACHATC